MMLNSSSGPVPGYPANWAEMTPAEKRKWRLDKLLNIDHIRFVSPEAKQKYLTRLKRTIAYYNVEEYDRVPVALPVGNLPFNLYGVNTRTAMYDYEQAVAACKKFNEQYSEELEYWASPFSTPGRVMDMLDYKLYAWPGHGLPMDAGGVQFVEGEYMKVEEYDDLIRDPSDFWMRKYLPRIFGGLEPLRAFSNMTNMIEVVSLGQLGVFADPRVQEMLLKLVEVGREYQRMMSILGPVMGSGVVQGYPGTPMAMAKAPFDSLGDTLRGTAPIMKDMYRRPDKVLEACDKLADLTIDSILKSPMAPNLAVITYPLHKGADGWMSQKQFDTFYWPSLKKVMNAFIKEGLIQNLFAEGSFNTRLESCNEFAKGTVTWLFDRSDMAKAKNVLGKNCGISGNIPTSLTVTGSAADVKAYCKKLIEDCAAGGGYTLAAGATAENPKLENLRAMLAAVKEYGIYKK
ncbi:MAG TPA: uroporphyrinogen decarboxylase family protein [Dehalococcoidales bacterium]|nr:uroporphyrinogen decarboxylase family protein [Dehalococcoidales bacterium]